MDRPILEKAVIHLAEYPEGGPLTVNLSQQTIHEDGFSTWITQLLRQYAPGNRLNIEINETAALNDIEHIVWFRNLLRPTGVQFGVDNFGVHPNGLSYLYSVQTNYIKIDGSLSRETDTSA
nr:EAL domain-containing protein [Pacificibacter marinus]